MSYGSTYIQSPDNGGRVTGRIPRARKEPERRVVHYEKEFDVNVSRIPSQARSIRESMIAYSEKMRSLADSRGTDPLFVRAKHIPKYPNKPHKKRRPMSFDELIGRDKEKRDREERPHAAKPRPLSDKSKPKKEREIVHLPVLSDRLKQAGNPKVRVSLVSASDLYDIVDFSLRSKGTREESIQILRMEQESLAAESKNKTAEEFSVIQGRYDKYERTTVPQRPLDGNHPDVEFHTKDTASNHHYGKDNVAGVKLPSLTGAFSVGPEMAFRSRPNRVKRMRLQKAGLSDIPEDKMLNHEDLFVTEETNHVSGRRHVSSPPPAGLSPRSSAVAKSSLTAIQEVTDEPLQKLNNSSRNVLPTVVDSPKRTRRILMKDDGDVRIEVTQCPPKQDPLQNKLKAQKRFKKLIFLRDVR